MINTDLSTVKFTGRWHTELLNSELVHICFSSGNSIYFKVSNTSTVGLSFNPIEDTNGGGSMIFEYSVDGGSFVRTGEITETPVVLVSGLSANEHTIEIVFNIPYYYNAWSAHLGAQLKGILVDDGGLLLQWNRQWSGKALWIGDSIIEGEQSIAAGDLSNLKKGSRETYGWQVSRNHNMEYHTWAFGGMGMTQWYPHNQGVGGPRLMPILPNNFGYKMSGVVADDDPVFDWVVIEVGVNDYDASTSLFASTYQTFINTIKAKWPNAMIYCIGPMPIPMFLTQAANIQSLAQSNGLVWIDATSWDSLINGHLHPLAAEHAAIASAISPLFVAPATLSPITAVGSVTSLGATFTRYTSASLSSVQANGQLTPIAAEHTRYATASLSESKAQGQCTPITADYSRFITAEVYSSNAEGRASPLVAGFACYVTATLGEALAEGINTSLTAHHGGYTTASLGTASAEGGLSPITSVATNTIAPFAAIKGPNGLTYKMYIKGSQTGLKVKGE